MKLPEHALEWILMILVAYAAVFSIEINWQFAQDEKIANTVCKTDYYRDQDRVLNTLERIDGNVRELLKRK